MDRHKPAQQGSADGLCGIYSLLNFFQNAAEFQSEGGTPQYDAFQQLILAADKERLLTAWHLCEGYQWFDLIELFNRVARNYGIDFIAKPLAVVAKKLGTISSSVAINHVLEVGGSAVVHINNKSHWILVYGIEDEEFLVDDSAQGSEFKRLNRRGLAKRGTNCSEGLALVPVTSEIADWN